MERVPPALLRKANKVFFSVVCASWQARHYFAALLLIFARVCGSKTTKWVFHLSPFMLQFQLKLAPCCVNGATFMSIHVCFLQLAQKSSVLKIVLTLVSIKIAKGSNGSLHYWNDHSQLFLYEITPQYCMDTSKLFVWNCRHWDTDVPSSNREK